MAAFFDSGDDFDKALLYEGVQSHTAIARVIDEVEEAIVNTFTQEGASPVHAPSTGSEGVHQFLENTVWYTVYLWGFRPLAADANGFDETRADWSGFAKAMRLTIANVVSHRLRNFDDKPDLRMEVHGRESWSYNSVRDLLWPSGWSSLIDRYVPKHYDPRVVFST